MGRNGEDIGLYCLRAHVFQQCRIAQLAHDFVIDLTCFVFFQDFGFDGLSINPHGELVYRRTFGQREEVGAFQHPVIVVDE